MKVHCGPLTVACNTRKEQPIVTEVPDADLGSKLDEAGEARLFCAMRHFWHAVVYADEVAEGSLPVTLLDEPLLLFRDGDAIRCLYRADADPRQADELTAPLVTERFGLVWVSLVDEPAMPLPEFPQFHDPHYHVIQVAHDDWRCSAARRVENYVDFAHFPWVHDGILGDRNHPEVHDHSVARRDNELRFAYGGFVEPSDERKGLPMTSGSIDTDLRYRIFMPSTVLMDQQQPDDKHYVLLFTVSPIGPRTTRNFTLIARNYGSTNERDELIDYCRAIDQQDKPIVESQRPEQLPIDLSAELHIKGVDLVSLEYRRWLIQIAAEFGEGSA